LILLTKLLHDHLFVVNFVAKAVLSDFRGYGKSGFCVLRHATNHLSQNLTQKLWASLDLRYQHGGETTTDGLRDGNKINQWGGGASVGYTFSRAWSGFLGYGRIFGGDDHANGEMWRARLIFVF